MVEHPTYSIDINFGQVNQVRSFGSYSFVKNNIFSMPPLLYLCIKTHYITSRSQPFQIIFISPFENS